MPLLIPSYSISTLWINACLPWTLPPFHLYTHSTPQPIFTVCFSLRLLLFTKPTDVQAGKQTNKQAGESPGWHRLTPEDPRFWKSLHWYKKIALSGFPPISFYPPFPSLFATNHLKCTHISKIYANTPHRYISAHAHAFRRVYMIVVLEEQTPKIQEPSRRNSEKVNLIKTAKDRKFSRSSTSLKYTTHR